MCNCSIGASYPFTLAAGAEGRNYIAYITEYKNIEHLEEEKKEIKYSMLYTEDKLSDVRECVGGV